MGEYKEKNVKIVNCKFWIKPPPKYYDKCCNWRAGINIQRR